MEQNEMEQNVQKVRKIMERKVYPGEFYRHFKNKLYQVIAVAEHTETGESLVVYQALYGDFRVYARPLAMFLSPVDREKYPEVAQKYRFERVEFVRGEDGSGEKVRAVHTGEPVQRQKAASSGKDGGCTEERRSESQPWQQDAPDFEEPKLGEPNPDLIAFLDADSYEGQMECLSKLAKTASQSDLNAVYVVLDMNPQNGSVAVQVDGIRRQLAAQHRFDGGRLR